MAPSFCRATSTDTPIESDDGTEIAGYLTPIGHDDPEYRFDGALENFPEGWLEERKGVVKLRSNRKNRVPIAVTVAGDGRVARDGEQFWYIGSASSRFAPVASIEPAKPHARA